MARKKHGKAPFAKVAALYRDGHSVEEIANILGVHPRTVYHKLPHVRPLGAPLPIGWRPCVGHPQYAVSWLGEVARIQSPSGRNVFRLLRQYRNSRKDGHLIVRLSTKCHVVKRLVHHLVAAAFIGPRPDGHEVDHKDQNPANNHADNLEWVTPKENTRRYRASVKYKITRLQQKANGYNTPKQRWAS